MAGSVMVSPTDGIPTSVTLPSIRAMSQAWTMSSGRPTTSNVKSAPRPPVRSLTAATGSPAVGSTAWVAPTARPASRREASGSTATIVAAPAM
jgi:hypothetical protein